MERRNFLAALCGLVPGLGCLGGSYRSKSLVPRGQRRDKTILVCRVNGERVFSIPATASSASKYLKELARFYGQLEVDYEVHPTELSSFS